MRITDRVAIITGAASGLGKAMAQRFAAEGARLAIVDINPAALATTVHELERAGATVAGFAVDVSRRDAMHRLAADVEARFGRIDILVSNAGVTRYAPFPELGDTQWDAVLAVDLKGVFYGAQAVAPYMRRQRYGKIVNVASVAGTGTTPPAAAGSPAGNAAYASAKAGVIQLTKTLARELGPDGINVNCVAPGSFLTPLTATTRSPEEVERHVAERARAAVLQRSGRPEELAGVVLFLASDDAGFMAGETLCVDGGRIDRM